MSTPAFKILHGTVIIGDAKGPLELKVLLDQHIKEMNFEQIGRASCRERVLSCV